MKNPTFFPVNANRTALDFVLDYGQEISDNALDLKLFFTEALLRFERAVGQIWQQLSGFDQFGLALDTARYVLATLLPRLNERLSEPDRFEWRIRLAHLFLSYMNLQAGKPHSESLNAMMDYYTLFWNGVNFLPRSACLVYNQDNWEAGDDDPPLTYHILDHSN